LTQSDREGDTHFPSLFVSKLLLAFFRHLAQIKWWLMWSHFTGATKIGLHKAEDGNKSLQHASFCLPSLSSVEILTTLHAQVFRVLKLKNRTS
jgi:hypothetical protein